MSWLGLTGLRWNATLVLGDQTIRSTTTCVGGAGGRKLVGAVQVIQPTGIDEDQQVLRPTDIARYQEEAASILAAMKRTR